MCQPSSHLPKLSSLSASWPANKSVSSCSIPPISAETAVDLWTGPLWMPQSPPPSWVSMGRRGIPAAWCKVHTRQEKCSGRENCLFVLFPFFPFFYWYIFFNTVLIYFGPVCLLLPWVRCTWGFQLFRCFIETHADLNVLDPSSVLWTRHIVLSLSVKAHKVTNCHCYF